MVVAERVIVVALTASDGGAGHSSDFTREDVIALSKADFRSVQGVLSGQELDNIIALVCIQVGRGEVTVATELDGVVTGATFNTCTSESCTDLGASENVIYVFETTDQVISSTTRESCGGNCV